MQWSIAAQSCCLTDEFTLVSSILEGSSVFTLLSKLNYRYTQKETEAIYWSCEEEHLPFGDMFSAMNK